MSSAFACPHCRNVIQTAAAVPAGKQVKCPNCKGYFLAPPTVALPVAPVVPAMPIPHAIAARAAVMPPPPPPIPHKKHKKEKKHRKHRRLRLGSSSGGTGGGLVKILVGALAMFLLMGAGAGAYLLFVAPAGKVAKNTNDDEDEDPPTTKKGKKKKSGGGDTSEVAKKEETKETKTETKKEEAKKEETKKEETKKDPPPAGKGPEDPLVMVAADTSILVGGNLKALAENAAFKKLAEGPLAKISADLKRDAGMELAGFTESAVIALQGSPSDLASAKMTLILKSKAAYDTTKLAASPAVAEKASAKGKTYYKLKADSGLAGGRKDAVLFAPSDRLLVISDLPKAEFEKLIGGDLAKPTLDKDALAVVQELSKQPAWAYVSLTDGIKKELQSGLMTDKAPDEIKPVAKALAGASGLVLWAEPGDDATLLAVGLICADDGAAKDATAGLTAYWKVLKTAGAMMAKLPPEVGKLAAELRAGAEFNQKGPMVIGSVTFPIEGLVGLLSSGEAGVKAAYPQFLAGLAGPAPLTLSKEEQTILDLVNKARDGEKLPPLKVNPVLMKMARDHAAAMAKAEKDDDTLDGKNHAARLADAGYKVKDKMSQANLVSAGLAVLKEPKIAVDAWLGDGDSKKNILGKYEETGIGFAMSDKKVAYYYQVFAVPE